jgi:hypothetical protein
LLFLDLGKQENQKKERKGKRFFNG